MSTPPWVALAGCPNTGKTTLFNALTGRRARVGNYPGITVERVFAEALTPGGPVTVVDVPGAYSLAARSADEQVAVSALLGLAGNPRPALTVVVLDATRLERNLYFALQVIELGSPVILAVNMMDAARSEGVQLDLDAMSAALGVPVVGVSARQGEGIDALRAEVARVLAEPAAPPPWTWTPGPALEADLAALAPAAAAMGEGLSPGATRALALWALLSIDSSDELTDVPAGLRLQVLARLKAAREAGRDVDAEGVTARYTWIDAQMGAWIRRSPVPRSWTDRLDAVLLHPVAGFVLFLGIMVVVFQALFAWSEPLIGLVEKAIGLAGSGVQAVVPAGIFADFLTDAVVGGVGNVLVFVPQIALLFVFISLMEDTGYMSRIAFLMDRIMNRVGLHGRAFVPMMSAYACAVPAVMATRTMERRRDRYLTMMVLPLTTCSARLPVYTLLIAALVPATVIFGVSAKSLVMVGLYLFGTITALLAAAVIGRTVLKGERVPLLMELPPYRRPSARSVGRRVARRSWLFIRDAGAFIFVCTAILWALLYFPRSNAEVEALERAHAAVQAPTAEQKAAFALEIEGAQKRGSIAGRIGHVMEPALEPFGQDWQVGVGLLGAFAAREVFVSTMGLIFGMGRDVDAESAPLRARLQSEKRPDGKPRYTPLSALALMIFLALACQCMSTLAAVKRETGGYKWPVFMFTYMTTLAWVCAVGVYQAGRLLGYG